MFFCECELLAKSLESSRTDHFHLKTGSQGGTEEISFYCEESQCRIKSFGGAGGQGRYSLGRLLVGIPLLIVFSRRPSYLKTAHDRARPRRRRL